MSAEADPGTEGEHNSPKSAPRRSTSQWEQTTTRHNVFMRWLVPIGLGCPSSVALPLFVSPAGPDFLPAGIASKFMPGKQARSRCLPKYAKKLCSAAGLAEKALSVRPTTPPGAHQNDASGCGPHYLAAWNVPRLTLDSISARQKRRTSFVFRTDLPSWSPSSVGRRSTKWPNSCNSASTCAYSVSPA